MKPGFRVKCYKLSEFAKSPFLDIFPRTRERKELKAIKMILIEKYKERVRKGLPIFEDEDSNKN